MAEKPLQGGYHNPLLRTWQSRGKQLSPDVFMYPVFVSTTEDKLEEIPALPGQFKVGQERLVEYLKPMVKDGLKSVLLFPTDMKKEEERPKKKLTNEYTNPVINAIGIVKRAFPHVTVACDVCLCASSTHGLCYVLTDTYNEQKYNRKYDGYEDVPTDVYKNWWGYSDRDEINLKACTVDTKETLSYLRTIAFTYAKNGADIVAPSDMNDGRVDSISKCLEGTYLRTKCSIMSYSAKFASCMYGPFRDVCDSTPITNSRHGSQLPPGSSGLANRAVSRDVAENADIIMVKPAMMYLDVVRDIKKEHPNHPIAAYQVSGEYSMIHHSAANGVFDLKTMLYENFACMQRAGVDIIVSYYTPKVLKWIKEDRAKEVEDLTKLIEELEKPAEEEEEAADNSD